MNVSFYPRSEVRSDRKPVIARIRLVRNQDGDRISTGYKIKEEDWGDGWPVKKGRTSNLRNTLSEIQYRLEEWLHYIQNQEGREPDKGEVKKKVKELSNRVKGTSNKKPQTIIEFVEEQLEKRKGKGLAPDTLKKDRVTLKSLKAFDSKRTPLAEIDEKFGEAFKQFLLREKEQGGKGLENVSVNKELSFFKKVLKNAEEEGKVQKGTAERIKMLEETDKEPNPLLEEEIKEVEEARMNEDKLERVRHLLLFTINTGIRFGDLCKLTPKNFNRGWLIFSDNKTKRRQEIPLNSKAKDIAEAYDYQLPVIREQNYNKYLKELFERLCIDRVIVYNKRRDQKVTSYEEPFYKVVSSHVGRQTFITQALRKGFSSELVRKLSGHSTFEAFKRYISFSEEDKKRVVEHL